MKKLRFFALVLACMMLNTVLPVTIYAATSTTQLSTTSRSALYQSIDFGPYSVDSPSGEIIDNMQYKTGEP